MAKTAIGSRWAGIFKSRTQMRTENIQGVIPVDQMGQMGAVKKYRRECLELFDKYYEGTQYDNLPDWDAEGPYIPIRKRKPRLQFNFAKVLASRVAGKIVGHKSFPRFVNEQDPDWEAYIRYIVQGSNLQARLAEPMRRYVSTGSTFVRFYLAEGAFRVDQYHSKYCYPLFDEAGELASITVRYVYEDPEETDERGRPKQKWFQMVLSQDVDTLYDNPPYKQGEPPVFSVAAEAAHELGFVQGEWFRLSENRHNPDAEPLVADILGFIDELNYSLSQSSQAVQYNQDPQLAVSNMTEDEVTTMIRSAMKGWNLGREGKAEFLETSLTGVERAEALRDKVRLHLQDVTRIIMMDPEKMVANAQSGVALEVLHGPFVDLIEEIRPMAQVPLVRLVTKMGIANLMVVQRGGQPAVAFPPGWRPNSVELTAKWQPVFPMTIEDTQKKVNLASTVTTATIASREWALRYLAADLGIEDIEEELGRIAAQPVINPFGAF